MNVILFVTTLIMAMAMLTYAKMESYRSLSIVESQFNTYMEFAERSTINQAAEAWYKSVSASTKDSKPSPQAQGSSRLSFAYFITRSGQVTPEYSQFFYIAKKMIYGLYGHTPFFQQYSQLRPDFVDAILHGLVIAETLPQQQKIKHARDLANLSLNDEMLDDALYKMLQGTVDPYQAKPSAVSLPPELKKEADDEAPDNGVKNEYHSPAGYYSLLDYITLQPKKKIRIFLARRPLLRAIFNQEVVVDEVIAKRNQLYYEVKTNRMDPKVATDQFEQLFMNRRDSQITPTVLDFTVSKTNPKNYE